MSGRAPRPPLRRALLGAALLGVSVALVRWPQGRALDVRAGAALRGAVGARGDRLAVGTTDLGSLYAVAGMAGVLAAAGHRDDAADALAVGVAAWGLSQRSKRLLDRARPYEADGVRRLLRPPSGSSFPSGHAAVAAAWSTLLAERAEAPVVRAALPAVAAHVAATRVHVGVHYPSDVLAGAGLGLLVSAGWRGAHARITRAAARRLIRGVRASAPAAVGVSPSAAGGSCRPGRCPAWTGAARSP